MGSQGISLRWLYLLRRPPRQRGVGAFLWVVRLYGCICWGLEGWIRSGLALGEGSLEVIEDGGD